MKRKKPIPQKLSRKKIIIATALVLAVAILGLVIIDQMRHYQDRQKFMVLKQDVQALQAEFNQVDLGWQYSEACQAKGEKFKENEVSACYINLGYKSNMDISKYKALIEQRGQPFNISKSFSYENNGDQIGGYEIIYSKNNSVSCGMSQRTTDSKRSIIFGCHDSALDFYFSKTQ